MPIPVRSIRLQKRSSQSLDTLSGASGEIFFDADRGTLRLYTSNAAENIIIADRAWVTANTFNGDYASLTNIPPSAVTDVSQLTDTNSLFFDRSYNSLTDLPNLDDYVTDISTLGLIGDVNISGTPEQGQFLVWDGSIWVNQTVLGFTDTNTTYAVSASSTADGTEILLTDDLAAIQSVEFRQGNGIALAITDTNQITITNNATYALTDLSNVSAASPAEGNTLVYSSGSWISSAPSGGVALGDLSVTTDTESGGGSLTYNEGTFTFAPADLSSLPTLSSFSVTTDTAQSGGVLLYDNAGGFTFRPANLSGPLSPSSLGFSAGVTINEFSSDGTLGDSSNTAVPTEQAVKTYVDTAVSGAGGGASLQDTVIDIDATNGNVSIDATSGSIGLTQDTGDMVFTNTGSGTFDFGGSVVATNFSTGSVSAPTVTSASTVTITAPDGFIVTGGPFRLPSLSTTEKNALSAVNGDIIYDNTISQAQVYEGSWTSISGGGGIALTDLSVGAEGTASGDGAIAYNNGTGVFTYTPPDTSSFLTSVPAQSFSSLTGKPTTLAGYGITDAFNGVFSSLTSKPTTLAGYGITDGLSASAAPLISEVSSTINGATGTVVHNTTTGGVFYHTAPAANFTANFTNVPTTNDRITTVALIIAQGVTQYMPTAVQIGGAAQTIEWFGGSVPGGTANGFDIVSFTLIRQSSTWTVLGASSTYG